MSGINPQIGFAVARIRCTFSAAGAPVFAIRGTGFWIGSRDNRSFVTNRHNLDPSLVPGGSGLALFQVEIDLRHIDGNIAYPETQFFAVQNRDSCVRVHPNADCALLANPEFDCPIRFSDQPPVKLDQIADAEFLQQKVQIMDFASFLGFPGADDDPWWDQGANLPIARIASIASMPEKSFVNPAIRTADVVLVSGLSFSGSSGSPVFSHAKGFRAEPPLQAPFIPAKVIGIMSGHGVEPGPLPDMLQHTGLSYFTRSTSILELL